MLEVEQRDEVVLVLPFRKFLWLHELQVLDDKRIANLQEVLSRPNVCGFVIFGQLVFGVQCFLRGNHDPFETTQRLNHVFADCKSC